MLELIVDPEVSMVAQDDRAAFAYGDEQRGDADFARVGAWPGEPDWPGHGPRFVEKAAFTIEIEVWVAEG